MARDLQRYLADEVVEARPPSTGYRLRKLVRRNRGLVAAVGLIVLALVVGIAGTTWGMIRERLAKLDAEEQKVKAVAAAAAERAANDEHRRSSSNDKRKMLQVWWKNSPRPRSAKCRELSAQLRKTVA